RRIVLGDIEAEFFSRVIHITRERYVCDSGTCAQEIGRLGEPFVDDTEIVGDAALEERLGAWIARRREIAQETIGSETPVDFLIVENDPAEGFQALVLALGLELARAVGEIGETDAGLAEFPRAMHEDRNFAHFVDLAPEFRRARLSRGEEVHPDRFPLRADQVEHQGDAICIAGLGEAIELIFRRRDHCESLTDYRLVRKSCCLRLHNSAVALPDFMRGGKPEQRNRLQPGRRMLRLSHGRRLRLDRSTLQIVPGALQFHPRGERGLPIGLARPSSSAARHKLPAPAHRLRACPAARPGSWSPAASIAKLVPRYSWATSAGPGNSRRCGARRCQSYPGSFD